MKIVGLITEYNPFHNGHKYHIEKAKEITGADYVIAVMSGNFVQRGAPAILPKHLRTAMALDGGCDMVIELPVCYATGSAEYFASGAISILDNLGCVDVVCFGSECGNYEILETIARILVNEPLEYKELLQTYLKQGNSFPVARQQALKNYFHDDVLDAVLESPNNILGIEYIKAMLLRNSSMKGYTITREGASYHDDNLSNKFSSASAIRNQIKNNNNPDFEILENHTTKYCIDILKNEYQVRYPVVFDDFSLLLRYKLLSETKESLTEYMDITPDLANRIINTRNDFLHFTQFVEVLKTKELTYSRISRCLFHILLNIRKCHPGNNTYAHVLGFRKDSAELFSILKVQSQIPVITKLTDRDAFDEYCQELLEKDIYASDLYESVVSHKFGIKFINELQQQIVKY